ncbi:hypothetical protein LF1_00470 [Rubripirellula obstinata]|uniref:Uncharacterized protein n=1 Tax=Rubripirellula obstinata TaxID=406547 RepID=A0A5B1CD72_9BACT|nr:hypothetical protein LF1_00470 [Rubripirellula obstinata]
MPRRAVGTSISLSVGGKAGLGVRRLCPAGREAGSKCPRLSRITSRITGYGGKSQPSRKISQAVLRCILWLSALFKGSAPRRASIHQRNQCHSDKFGKQGNEHIKQPVRLLAI